MIIKYKCKSCPFIASDIKLVIDHKVTHEPIFECEICSSKYKSKCSLRIHIKKYHHQVEN